MERHKERVKLLVRNVVQQDFVQRVVEIQIPVLLALVHVGQLPHVEDLRFLIIYVHPRRVDVDHRLHALRELQ